MRKLLLCIALLLLSPPAIAQQTTAGDRIAVQIGRLVLQIEQQHDQITSLQEQLDKAQKRIKELEPRPEAGKGK